MLYLPELLLVAKLGNFSTYNQMTTDITANWVGPPGIDSLFCFGAATVKQGWGGQVHCRGGVGVIVGFHGKQGQISAAVIIAQHYLSLVEMVSAIDGLTYIACVTILSS